MSLSLRHCLPAFFLGALLLAVPARAVQVRIASYNILNGLDTSSDSASSESTRDDDWWQVIDSIRRIDPDIVGFTELNNNDFDKLPELAAVLGYPYYAISTETMHSGSYRQAVMSKFEITASSLVKETAADPDAAEIKRWPIHATIAVPGALNPLHVFVVHTHPGTIGKANRLWRAMNAWRMRQYLDAMNASLPDDVEYVVMGDFNEDATGSIGSGQHESFTYDYYIDRRDAGTLFGAWFHLGSDFPWSTDTSYVLPYKLYPSERFNDLSPVTSVCRTGFSASDSGALATYPSSGYTLDYILFSSEIMQSAYGAPECEVYWGANDASNNPPGLSKPGPYRDTLATGSTLTENKSGLDHLMVFGDFHMIDAVAGLSPVAIISEVVHHSEEPKASYIEISNTGAAALKVDNYTLEVYFDGASTNGLSVPLSGNIGAGKSIWIVPSASTATNRWKQTWDHAPDFVASGLREIDGNDAIVLKNASGTIIDVYGAVSQNGLHRPWNYAGQTATRVPGVTEPITVWSAAEWTFAGYPNATPGFHEAISEADAAVSGLAFSPAAPAVGAPFALSATVQPNALASNLAVFAHFSLNGASWTNRCAMSNAENNVWTLSPVVLDPAPAAGDLLSCLVEVAFDGPGDLSPVYSSQLDYVFPGLVNGLGKLRFPLFNEVAPAAGFAELVGPENLSLAGWTVEHWGIAESGVAPLWTNVFSADSALSAAGISDEWGNPVGFAVSTNEFEVATPAALVLRNPQGAVVDAVAWLPANAPDTPFVIGFLPDTVLSTNVAQGLANYLHALGSVPADSAKSLQAPDWVLAGRATNAHVNLTQWKTAAATRDALNSSQTNGALRLIRVDRDDDSLFDDEDNCPATHNPTQADIDGDGLGNDCDDDMDGDGIPNAIDNCPSTPNPEQEDFDGDGIGDACDDDFDESLLPATESFFVTFDAVTNGYNADYPSSFSEGGRFWSFTDAAAYGGSADRKIGSRAARIKPGGVLALSGPLTNGLSSVAFFVAPHNNATTTPLLVLETSPDGQDWTFLQAVQTDLSTNLSPVIFPNLGVPGPVFFRLRLETGDESSVRVNLDNLRIVSNVPATADADLDSDLSVAYDGLAHTNSFTVTPANATWSVVYTNVFGETVAAPVEIGEWTAVVTVATTNDIQGGRFVFPGSLVIVEPVGTPEFSELAAAASAVSALLTGKVTPNRSSDLEILFEYGSTPHFGNKVRADGSPVSGHAPLFVETLVENLLPDSPCYWRIVAGDTVSETQFLTTDFLEVPAPSVSGISSNAFLVDWPAVEGATNYILEVHTLSGGGSGETIVESFSDWDYYYDYMAILGFRSSFHEQTNAAGVWSTTNSSVYNTKAASGVGSKGHIAISTGGWLQTPPVSDVVEVAFAARVSGGSGTLSVQVSEDGGATFSEAASFNAINKTTSWKTNTWSAPLPANAILRFANAGSREICLHDLRIVSSSTSSAHVPGYPASIDPYDSAALAENLAPATTYYLSVVAQGNGWETEASPVISVTTLDGVGQTPAIAKWLFTPDVAVGSTLVTNVTASGDPDPALSLLSSTATGSAALADAATNGINVSATLSYIPSAADVGTQTFTIVASNQYGSTTQNFAVAVTPAADPYTLWLASLDLDRADFAPDADSDSDGISNWQEYLAGTNPDDPASRFEISFSTASVASNTVVWTFPGTTSRVYQLVTSSNLIDFVTNSLSPDPVTGTVSFTNSLLETLFSRLRASPPVASSP